MKSELCHNCLKPIFPEDKDAGTYKEYFCSETCETCETEAEKKMSRFIQKQKLPEMIWKIENGFLSRYRFSALVDDLKETAFYMKDDRFVIIVDLDSINKKDIFDNPVKGYEKIKSDLEYHLSLINGELKRLNIISETIFKPAPSMPSIVG